MQALNLKRSWLSRQENISRNVNGEWVEQNGMLGEVLTVWWSWVISVADDGKKGGWRGCWGSCHHGYTLCIKRFRLYYVGCGMSGPDPLLQHQGQSV